MYYQSDSLPSIFLKKEKTEETLNHLIELRQELCQFENVNHENVALCFLVDATGSMKKYVSEVKAQIHGICASIKGSMQQNQRISISMVAYRDRKDSKPIEKIEFTECIDNFIQFADKLDFTGGGDDCEDIKAGFKAVLDLNWSDSNLNLLIWIADSPCHGKKYHSTDISDNYSEDNQEIEDYLKQFSEKNIDTYFYKTSNVTDQMIKIFQEKSLIYDKFLLQSSFQSCDLTQRIVGNHRNSKSLEIFSQFFRFIQKFEKTDQLERCQKLKQINKKYISLQLNQNSDSLLNKKKDRDVIQASDIKNLNDIEWNETQIFEIFQLKLNSSKPDQIEVIKQDDREIQLSKVIIGQGSFKECFLGQDEQRGTYYAMKRFKEQTIFDLDNLILENIVHLIASKIRDSFIKQLKQNSTKEEMKNDRDLKLYFDDLLIAHDIKNEQFYLLDVVKFGFLKFINNDSKIQANLNNPQSDFFQSFIHYSFEYSGYNFILSDIQGFGNVLNDISLHSQNIIDEFQHVQESQLTEQFKKGTLNLEKIKINTQINSNLGDLGIVLFLNQHNCNQYCKRLNVRSLEDLCNYQALNMEESFLRESSLSQQVDIMQSCVNLGSFIEQVQYVCQQDTQQFIYYIKIIILFFIHSFFL